MAIPFPLQGSIDRIDSGCLWDDRSSYWCVAFYVGLLDGLLDGLLWVAGMMKLLVMDWDHSRKFPA